MAAAPKKKLSYKEQRELDALPARIEALEAERARVNAAINGPEFYKAGADTIRTTLARVGEIAKELETAYARWGTLEARATSGAAR